MIKQKAVDIFQRYCIRSRVFCKIQVLSVLFSLTARGQFFVENVFIAYTLDREGVDVG